MSRIGYRNLACLILAAFFLYRIQSNQSGKHENETGLWSPLPLVSSSPVPELIRTSLTKCRIGDKNACRILNNSLDALDSDDNTLMTEVMEPLCKFLPKEGFACWHLGKTMARASLEPMKGKCKKRDVGACLKVAGFFEQNHRESEAMPYAYDACVLGSVAACLGYAEVYGSAGASKFQGSCEKGDNVACRLAASAEALLAHGNETDPSNPHRTKIAKQLGIACGRLDQASCWYIGKFLTPLEVGALQRSCAAGSGMNCLKFAGALDEDKDRDLLLISIRQACVLGVTLACELKENYQ